MLVGRWILSLLLGDLTFSTAADDRTVDPYAGDRIHHRRIATSFANWINHSMLQLLLKLNFSENDGFFCASMASVKCCPSSSSFVSSGRLAYDVFLSFKGEDTRNTFVDRLYGVVVPGRVYTFKDDEMLRRGNPISPEHMKAIKESRCVVAVFSENYANSSWCLDELAKIKECRDHTGQRALPEFYHVDPIDVQGQKGNFSTTFQQHKVQFSGEADNLKRRDRSFSCNF